MVTLINPRSFNPPATAMAAPQPAAQGRLTIQAQTIAPETTALRCLD